MRLAIISDIHSNLAAFEAVLEDVARRKVDQVVINGDIINGGPDPVACLELAYRTGFPIVAGNHERYIRDFDAPDRPPEWGGDLWKPSRWTADQLGSERRAALHGLPNRFTIDSEVLVVHASVRADKDSVFSWTDERELPLMFPAEPPALIIRSHNHIPQFRPWGQRLIVTSGAVGQPLDGNPLAKYVLARRSSSGWQVRHQLVEYDVAHTLRRFHDSGLLEFARPLAQLYAREVQLGTHHMVPFLRLLAGWQLAEPELDATTAVRRFMHVDV